MNRKVRLMSVMSWMASFNSCAVGVACTSSIARRHAGRGEDAARIDIETVRERYSVFGGHGRRSAAAWPTFSTDVSLDHPPPLAMSSAMMNISRATSVR